MDRYGPERRLDRRFGRLMALQTNLKVPDAEADVTDFYPEPLDAEEAGKIRAGEWSVDEAEPILKAWHASMRAK
jgi:hypothetical protein